MSASDVQPRQPEVPLPPIELRGRVGAVHDDDLRFDQEGRRCYEAILRALPSDFSLAGARVLDFGCGAGRVLRQFVREHRDADLWGCDVHEPSIAWLQAHLSPPLHVFVNDTAPPLPLETDSVDLVYALSVWTHLADDWSDWLLELHRILGPTGVAVITTLGEPMWEQHLGKPFFQDQLRRPWDDERVGLFVTNYGMPQDDIGPVVYQSEWWTREHWGRAFEILDFAPWGFSTEPGRRDGQGVVTLRPRPVEVDRAALEAPGPNVAQELEAVQANLSYVHAEMAAWRDLAAAAGAAYEAAAADAAALADPPTVPRRAARRIARGWSRPRGARPR